MVRRMIGRGKENRPPRKQYVDKPMGAMGRYYTTRIRAVETVTADNNGNVSLNYNLSRFYVTPMNGVLKQAFLEGRINYYKVSFVPNVNFTNSNTLCRALFIAPYHGVYNPSVTNNTVLNMPGSQTYSPSDTRLKICKWRKSKSDPEEEGYRPLNSSSNFSSIGGIIFWVDGSFPVSLELGQIVEEWGITYRESAYVI